MGKPLTLAFTNVRDLLIEHKLTESGESSIDEPIRLSIPNYQRPYKWSEKNVLQLFEDIVQANDSNRERYRMGTLILHKAEKDDGAPTYEIVDGQQRVITLTLLLRAFCQVLEVQSEEGKLALLEQKLKDNPDSGYNIPTNYRALERRVDKLGSVDKREALFEYVKNNCELIVIITDDVSEAFQFFDSQNARGKKLYPHDLLKAFHLREMRELDASEVENIVQAWESLDQQQLALLFSDYLFCIKQWVRGNPAYSFSEHDIQLFKGVSGHNNFPYAQFYKGAYSYAKEINDSRVPFVTGMQGLRPFQLDTPIIAGKPFFEYAQHYFAILEDVRDNRKYEGYFVNDNDIVKTLDTYYKYGTGNQITRRLFDTAVLLYIDRFCPDVPSKKDLDTLDEFVEQAFVWAYSLRAQSAKLGWKQAQKYILARYEKNDRKTNSFNIYKTIIESESPRDLLGTLSELMQPLTKKDVRERSRGKNSREAKGWEISRQDGDEIYEDYLHHFKQAKYWGSNDE